MEKAKAKEILNSLIKRGVKLQKVTRDSPHFEKWKRDTRVAITNIFGSDTTHIRDFYRIKFTSSYVALEYEYQEIYVAGLQHSVAILQSMIEEIDQYWTNSAPETKHPISASSSLPYPTKVFVVHGRNANAVEALFSFLGSIGLNAVEWNQAIATTKKGSPNIGEILDAAFDEAQAVVVLLTGDDEAKLRTEFLKAADPIYERELTPQSRPNVLFESGMAIGRYPKRTVLVQIGEHRPFSDIAGTHITHMDNTAEKRKELATKLANAGCKVNTSGTRWFKAGNFE